jgi:hypothetical protein
MDSFLGWEEDPTTLHKYLYANVDPVNTTDPSGHFGVASLGSTLNILGNVMLRVSLPSVFGAGAKAVAITCLAQMVSSMIVADLPAAMMNSQQKGCEMNQMRVQLQQGSLHTISHVAHATPNPGVTTNHVRAKLKHLYYSRSGASWFPVALDKWMYDSIVALSRDLARFPPYGVTMGGNILRKETYYRGKEYRIDIENLRGHNLRK